MTSEFRIGLISDTHMPGALKALWPGVFDFFSGCDAILHAGDLHTLDIVDALSKVAPTYVALGNGDEGLTDPRLAEHWLLTFGETQVGMMHHCPSPERKPATVIEKQILKRMKTLPDILVFGHTHFESITEVGSMVLINPGSPTLPHNQTLRPGTLGMITLKAGLANFALYQIEDGEVLPHPTIAALTRASTSVAISV